MSARNLTPSFKISSGVFGVAELQALYSRLQRTSSTMGDILDRIPSQTVSEFPANLRNRPITGITITDGWQELGLSAEPSVPAAAGFVNGRIVVFLNPRANATIAGREQTIAELVSS
jgi:hypothetical protein